jgi:hypothetical protein
MQVLGTGRIDSHFPSELAKPNQGLSDGWDDIEDGYVWLLVQLVTRPDPSMPALESGAAVGGISCPRPWVGFLLSVACGPPDKTSAKRGRGE